MKNSVIVSLILACLLRSAQAAPEGSTAVQAEMTRLSQCHPAFKLSPPPVHMRFVWTQPFDIVSATEGKDRISIEFTVQYAQSANFATQEDAAKTQEFNPNFNLRQRNHYAIDHGQLRLLWRESLSLDSHWKRQLKSQPEFACWQTVPDAKP